MAAGRNGNGRKGANGRHGDVPRWVRTLFDQHERRMAEHEAHMAALEEASIERAAEHEARMARLEVQDQAMIRELAESRRQTREIVKEISRLDAERKAESAERKAESARNIAAHQRNMVEYQRNMAEHRAIMAELKDLRDRR